jgi:hypothetical protein
VKARGASENFRSEVKAQTERFLLLSKHLNSYKTLDSKFELEFKFESHTNKIQNKSHKLQGSQTSNLYFLNFY